MLCVPVSCLPQGLNDRGRVIKAGLCSDRLCVPVDLSYLGDQHLLMLCKMICVQWECVEDGQQVAQYADEVFLESGSSKRNCMSSAMIDILVCGTMYRLNVYGGYMTLSFYGEIF